MSGDLAVNGTTYRRNRFNEWHPSSPLWRTRPVSGELSDCLDEIVRLRASVDAVLEAVDNPGPVIRFHRQIASQHRREWAALWSAIDRLREARRG